MTEQERNDIITLIYNGQTLSKAYLYKLFADEKDILGIDTSKLLEVVV